jgi:Secretion system C-terminal sorting domain
MKAAILIEGQNREYPICSYSDHVIPPDFQYEGKDGITNVDKYRTEYYDMVCLGSRKFQANSYYNSISAAIPTNPLPDVGCPNAFINKGYIKFMINLRRNNATATTQNILYVATFPLKIVTDNSLPNFVTDDLCNDSTIVASASIAEVNSLCNSTTSYYTPSRYNRVNRDNLGIGQNLEKDGLAISPNPSTGLITVRLKQQKAILKSIFITNMNGQKVFEINTGAINLATGHNQQIDVQLANGMYFVNCVTDNGLLNAKMVLAK